jgi:transcription termination factor NusB
MNDQLHEFDWESGEDSFPDHTKALVEDGRTEARIVAVQWAASSLLVNEPMALEQATFAGQAKRRKADKKVWALLAEDLPHNEARYTAMVQAHFKENWPWERTNVVLRAVLLVAASELTANPKLGTGAVLNEYMNIAKGFLPAEEVAFTRATLEKLVTVIRPA